MASKASVRVQIDRAAVQQLLTGSSGPVVAAVTDLVRRGNNAAKLEAPVDTGRLRASHQYTVTVNGSVVIGSFGTDVEYAEAVHQGHLTRPSTVSHRGRTASVQRRVPGNPWLKRAAARVGITVNDL